MEKKLIAAATEARKNAYAPYSGFSVGAALLCADGKIYRGCNVENAAFGDTVCAERAAICAAIADGEREFSAIAIVGGRDGTDTPCMPCGSCRQFMAELCAPEFEIILNGGSSAQRYTLGELLPHAFSSIGEEK